LSLEKYIVEEPAAERKIQTITGTLRFADATKIERPKIKLIDESGVAHNIIVPEGMMSDIVKPLWEEPVIVTGFYRRGAIQLEKISRASTD